MIEELMTRLQVTKTQVEMAYYSGAIPKNIDPEPFIEHWERKIQSRNARNRPITQRPSDAENT